MQTAIDARGAAAMYKEKNGTDSTWIADGSARRSSGVSEAERLRAKGEARRRSRRKEKEETLIRDREAEARRSETLSRKSGSRYSDKQTAPVEEGKSRYADKQPGAASVKKQAAVKAAVTAVNGRRHIVNRTADAVSAPPAVRSETAKGNLWQRWISGLKRKDSLAIAVLLVGMVFIGCYCAVGVFFASHFYPGTKIYQIDCSKLTSLQAREAIDQKIGRFVLKVDGRGTTDEVTAAQVGLAYRDEGAVEHLLNTQKSFLWPVMMLVRKNVELDVNTQYDADRITDVLSQMNSFREENIVRPENARIGSDSNGYIVIPEEMGNQPDPAAVSRALRNALDTGNTTISLEKLHCYNRPTVFSDDPKLSREVQEKNALLGADFTIDFGEQQEKVDASVLMPMIEKAADGSYVIPDQKIYDYVASLAQTYDTYGGYRSFRTSLGTTVDLYGGDYGWSMDQEATAAKLLDAIHGKQTGTLEPEYWHTAMKKGLNDIGDTYVEVSISAQEMWCYQNGVLMVDTPVVTGNPNTNHATPSGGVWEIDAKMRDYTLVGPGYRAPVSYWMPFNEDVGIHDLQGRYYYGGTIYQYNGSHGCVNTPLDAVSQIYDIVSEGTAVVVYD